MRQAQQLQANMQKAQEQLGSLEVTGEAGGGMIKVTMNGRHEVRRVQIDSAVATDDREMLEDLLAAACNDATRRVAEAVKQRMADAMGDMQLPPGMNLPL
jgi:DNA-binding YbaB/EbfC family protein